MPQEVHEAASMRTAEAGAIVNEFYRVHHGELSRTIVLAQLSLQQSALQERCWLRARARRLPMLRLHRHVEGMCNPCCSIL